MDNAKVAEILRELWRYKDTDKYTEEEIREALEKAASAFSGGEYIKKEDALSELDKWEWQELYLPIHFKENILDVLPTYSFPKIEEGVELIDRNQIKWYGCDHEGKIKGINCETADCSKCFFATVEHDEVMGLPVYPIPEREKGEWIYKNYHWECSCCGGNPNYGTGFVPNAETMKERYKFCNLCGADMRGKAEPYKAESEDKE